MKQEPGRAFLGLDILRGVAALIIAMGHAEVFFGFHPGSGYLAVDLFFALSGFVLAYAYDQRFAQGMSALAFMRTRLIRLYPLYLLGLIGVSVGIVLDLAIARHASWTARSLAASFGFNLGFLPTPPGIAPRASIYPLNTPAWSLAFELVVNLAFAAGWRRLTDRTLGLILALSLVGLVVTVAVLGSLAAGAEWGTVWGGFPRVFFSFFLGVLLWRRYQSPRFTLPLGVSLPILLMLLVLIVDPGTALRPWYDLLCVTVVFPALVLAGAAAKPGRLAGFCAFMGAISYALYALHFPIFEMSLALLKMRHVDLPRLSPWLGVAFVALIVVVAHLADVAYDGPVRTWINRRLPRPAR